MSAIDAGATSALTPTEQAREPSWVRNGSSAVKQDYEVAGAFEEMLVDQLASTLNEAGGLGEESEGSQEEGAPSTGSGSALSSMLPQALSQGVLSGGGLGLAAQLTEQMQGVQGAAAGQTGKVDAQGGTSS